MVSAKTAAVSLQKLPLSRYKHSETDDLQSKYGGICSVYYGSILTPRISGDFNACADNVYQALFSAYEKELGVKARWVYYFQQHACR